MFKYPSINRVLRLYQDFGNAYVGLDFEESETSSHEKVKIISLYAICSSENKSLRAEAGPITPWFRTREDLDRFLFIHMQRYEELAKKLNREGEYDKHFKWFWL